MNIRDVLGVLRRRWWLIVPAVVVALVAGGVGYVRTAPQYTQSESYLLLYPVMTEGGPGNPFLQLGNGVSMAASVLATKVSASQAAGSLTADHPGLTFSVALDVSTGAPIVAVSAEDEDPKVLTATLDKLGEALVAQLADLQKASGAPEERGSRSASSLATRWLRSRTPPASAPGASPPGASCSSPRCCW